MRQGKRGTFFESFEEWEAHQKKAASGSGSHSFGQGEVERQTFNPDFDSHPTCPYCNSERLTPCESSRYHCNNCFRNLSSTVGTEYHNSRISTDNLEKLKELYREGYTTRDATRAAGVAKATVERYFKIWDERAHKQTPDFGHSQAKSQSNNWVEDSPTKSSPKPQKSQKPRTFAEWLCSGEETEVGSYDPLSSETPPTPAAEKTWSERIFGREETAVAQNQEQSEPVYETQEKTWAEQVFGREDEPVESPPPQPQAPVEEPKKEVNRFSLFGF